MFTGIIENVLTSTSTTNGLSANMGRVLNNNIEALEDRVEILEDKSTTLRLWT